MKSFTLNRNTDVDVLHVEHPHEECNIDDASDRQRIDARTAAALLDHGQARACGHCSPDPGAEL